MAASAGRTVPSRARNARRRVGTLAGGVTALAALACATGATAATWPTSGQNLSNTRFQADERILSADTVPTLAPKWTFDTDAGAIGGDVSATPAADDTRLYFPDSAGNLFAVDRKSGEPKWTARIPDATGIPGDYARATPAIAGNTLILGAQSGKFQSPTTPENVRGAWVLGYDKRTGALRWKTRVDSHFAAMVTQSAQIDDTTAYVGVASNEEAYANPALGGGEGYVCCSFRGSLLAIDTVTGAIRWKTYMTPADAGYSGSAVWGSAPAVDGRRGMVYIATGNNYSLPPAVAACVDAAPDRAGKDACMPENYFDAIVALDKRTGAIRWAFKALPTDAWNTDCGLPGFDETAGPNCPANAGPDYDFGQGPMLFTATSKGQRREYVGAGSKSGRFFTVDRDTGALVWETEVGAGGLTGGLQWGSATDGRRIYVAQANSTGLQRGYWAALDVATGQLLWQRDDPAAGYTASFGFFGYSSQGPVAVANGVVYGCTLAPEGTMVAMRAATGEILWSRDSGSSCLGGATIVDGTVFWGTGYRSFGITTPGDKVFAFTANGR